MNSGTALSSEILRGWLRAYLAGEVSIVDFQRWFMPEVWQSDRKPRVPLARSVELRLAEYTNGHWTESELQELVRDLLGISTTGNPAHGMTVLAGFP